MNHGDDLHLVPVPRRLSLREGTFNAQGKRYIKLEADDPQSLVTAAKKTGIGWEITASANAPNDPVGLVIRLDKAANIPAEGYKLAIRPEIMEIAASTPAGAFYGACTLAQIVRCRLPAVPQQASADSSHPSPSAPTAGQSAFAKETSLKLRLPRASDFAEASTSAKATTDRSADKSEIRNIPCLSISDWPDFPERGVMLDISRDKVPTMETLYHLVDLLAEWKINQFQLYTEHTFAYLAHPKVWAKASPMTGEEIMALDAYCNARFIELVPNQNSFGHMERWLKYDEYRPLAECRDGFDTPWGFIPTSLNPISKRSVRFLEGLYDELLPHFSSRLFNVGCDETWELGHGKSKRICEQKGRGRVYLDFLLEIYRLAKERGRTMQFWGDIIMHHPELIPELPKDLIALEWGYEFDHPFAERGARFAESGIPFYVCPGTSSWNSLAGRTGNAIGNISSAARIGLQQGAIGLLNTDWGDNGHWQPLPVSYLGYMVGAMASWNAKANVKKCLAESLSLHAFGDCTGKMGKAFHDIGDIYRVFKKHTRNCTIPWQMLFRNPDDASLVEGTELGDFEELEHRLKDITYATIGEDMTCPDAAIVREEFEHLVRMLQLAAEVGKLRLGGPKPKKLADRAEELRKDHELIWLMRNRPGGLADSEAKLRIAME
ncbi:MAG TPA: family 20 glycosylhydrolase [Armatimonadota bacterium]|nr:family 20 glycosylhydrolase [Armatimonadota bacterium]